jgi:hypothetical protein
MVEATSIPETSVNFHQTTRRYSSEYSHLHTKCNKHVEAEREVITLPVSKLVIERWPHLKFSGPVPLTFALVLVIGFSRLEYNVLLPFRKAFELPSSGWMCMGWTEILFNFQHSTRKEIRSARLSWCFPSENSIAVSYIMTVFELWIIDGVKLYK